MGCDGFEVEHVAEGLREAVELFEMSDGCNEVGSDRWVWLQRARITLDHLEGKDDTGCYRDPEPGAPALYWDKAAGDFRLDPGDPYIPPPVSEIMVTEVGKQGEVLVMTVQAQFQSAWQPIEVTFNYDYKTRFEPVEPDIMEMTNDDILFAKIR